MALGGIVQSLLILVIVLMYTATVWKSLDQYFRDEFKKHLELDYKTMQKLKKGQLVDTKVNLQNAQDGIESEIGNEETLQQQDKLQSCRQENMPADKYKNQDEDELNSEVCLYIPLE